MPKMLCVDRHTDGQTCTDGQTDRHIGCARRTWWLVRRSSPLQSSSLSSTLSMSTSSSPSLSSTSTISSSLLFLSPSFLFLSPSPSLLPDSPFLSVSSLSSSSSSSSSSCLLKGWNADSRKPGLKWKSIKTRVADPGIFIVSGSGFPKGLFRIRSTSIRIRNPDKQCKQRQCLMNLPVRPSHY